jgi:hypothetical protein
LSSDAPAQSLGSECAAPNRRRVPTCPAGRHLLPVWLSSWNKMRLHPQCILQSRSRGRIVENAPRRRGCERGGQSLADFGERVVMGTRIVHARRSAQPKISQSLPASGLVGFVGTRRIRGDPRYSTIGQPPFRLPRNQLGWRGSQTEGRGMRDTSSSKRRPAHAGSKGVLGGSWTSTTANFDPSPATSPAKRSNIAGSKSVACEISFGTLNEERKPLGVNRAQRS